MGLDPLLLVEPANRLIGWGGITREHAGPKELCSFLRWFVARCLVLESDALRIHTCGRAVEHMVSLIPTLLDVILQGIGIQWLK